MTEFTEEQVFSLTACRYWGSQRGWLAARCDRTAEDCRCQGLTEADIAEASCTSGCARLC